MSESGNTIITNSETNSHPGLSASRFSESSSFKNFHLGSRKATDWVFVCLRYLRVFWEVQALGWLCFILLNRSSEINGVPTHPKYSLYLNAVNPELSPPHFSSLFTSFQNFELCYEFVFHLFFQFSCGKRLHSSQFFRFSFLISVRPQRQELLTSICSR